ncbi:MAG TPA: hypothetical protein VGG74_36730 [Kofleriaceae bacterium]|jgi:hypothetical protein
MSYRDDVDALAARHDSLEHELADKTRELADAANVLEEARAKRRLPLLDNIRVATPCSAKWDSMLGDDRVRHCTECSKNVYNLSGMTRDEAEALLTAKNGDLCARYFQRADGTILTADCTVGVSKRRKRKLIAAGAAALLSGGGFAAYRSAHRATPHVRETGGAISFSTVPAVELPRPEPRYVDPAPVYNPPPMPLMGAVAVPIQKVGKPTIGHVSKMKP